MSERMRLMVVALGIVVIAAIIGSALALEKEEEGELGDLKKFGSPDEIREYLKAQAAGSGYRVDYAPAAKEDAVSGSMPLPSPQMEPGVLSRDGAGDYSVTNVQVHGVDEPDFVKNDGRYIYLLSGNTLAIIDAYPAERAVISSETTIRGQPVALFIGRDRLAVFSTAREEVFIQPKSSAVPVPYWRTMTHACVYSIRDRKNPELIRDLSFSGNYYDARLIQDHIYVITSESVPWFADDILLPEVRDGDRPVISPDVYYPDIAEAHYLYHTLSSFSIKNSNAPQAETFLLGYANTVYVSQGNFYIGYRTDIPGGMPPREDCRGQEKTIIHRFGIRGGNIDYKGMGTVPGHLLNQFSLDEYDGHLRVATTVQEWTERGSVRYNNVYVLGEDMETVGELEFLAPDERIYATRFIGERLYMVTFKQIDPLFVIDLSDPENPGVLGELKIPGYSDYLHPYDSDHILGLGKETSENQWGGASVGGLKIALFDISDVHRPTLVDSVEIGEAGTDSEALRDHKAFLFDKRKDLLVVPVFEVQKSAIPDGTYRSYRLKTWQGAYVFGVSPADGFTLRGTVGHGEGDSPHVWWSSNPVRRSLYMDDVLYTISPRSVVMTDLTDIGTRIGEISLPQGAPYPYYRV
ncbi:hypothetical protein ASZ90_009940 [hydrocarbon metagenome]|uniref:Beta propeller domain protein n=1 Tax=hydrocarbon metagenome TaxID=938273 RepID=A0A0W8FHI9_9ZZZZ